MPAGVGIQSCPGDWQAKELSWESWKRCNFNTSRHFGLQRSLCALRVCKGREISVKWGSGSGWGSWLSGFPVKLEDDGLYAGGLTLAGPGGQDRRPPPMLLWTRSISSF